MNNKIMAQDVHCIHYINRLRLENGGVVRFVLDICQVLSSQGIKVTLITQDAKDIPEDWLTDANKPDVVELKQKKLPGGFLTPTNMRRVAGLFSEHKNTVINFHIPWVLSNFQLARLANQHKVPYIVTPHGSLDTWSMDQKNLKKEIFWFLFGKKHYRDARCIHYTAESEKEQGQQYIIKESAFVIPCLFDSTEFANLPDSSLAESKFSDIDNERPNILFLSRIHPKKGTDILVRATRLLKDRGVECNVLLAGPDDVKAKGYRAELEQLINELDLVESVHLIGMVKGREKLSLYNRAELFVLPTHQENFGFVLVEAMACGTPVVTSFGVDIWREIERGGATITENIPELVAEKIAALLADKEALNALGEKSREWVFKEFDAAKLAADYSAMYTQAALS